jgi:hypothetical protein
MACPAYNPRKPRLVDTLMQEHVKLPGFPQLIVTRGFALQYLVKELGDGEAAKYSAMQAREVVLPLTDTKTRDHWLHLNRRNPLIPAQAGHRLPTGIRYGLEIDVTGRGSWEEVGLYGKRGEAEKEGRAIQKRDGFPYRVKGTRDQRNPSWGFLGLQSEPPKPHVRHFVEDGDTYAELTTPQYFEVRVRSNVTYEDKGGTSGYYVAHGYESAHAVKRKLEKKMNFNSDWDVTVKEHPAKKEEKLVKRQFENPLTGSPSRDIPLLRHEGYGQRQAVAIVMERERANPAGFYETNVSLTLFKSPNLRGSTVRVSAYTPVAEVLQKKGKRWLIRCAWPTECFGWVDKEYLTHKNASDRENPLQLFSTRREALAFSSRVPGSTVIPADNGFIVRFPVMGVGRRNPGYSGEPMTSEHGHRWYYFIPYMPRLGRRHAGTGGYFDSLADAKAYARTYSNSLKGEWKGKPVEIQDVHHAIVSKRNPEGSSAASELYEQFHGEPSDGVTVYKERIEIPEDFVELGDLVELKVATLHGKDVTITAPDPDRYDVHEIVKLASSPDGKQLYFIGGDESLQLDKLGFKGDEVKPHMVIGVLYELTYRTRKGFDKFKLTDYYHATGEDTDNQPMLNYDEVNNLMSVVGGEYRVKDVGIVN